MLPPLNGADIDVRIHRTQGHGRNVAGESPRDTAQNPIHTSALAAVWSLSG